MILRYEVSAPHDKQNNDLDLILQLGVNQF